MAKTLIFSPLILGNENNHYLSDAGGRSISFSCSGLEYEDQTIKRVSLNAENFSFDFVEKYLSAPSLLTFEVSEASVEENNVLSLEIFRFAGFYTDSLTFTVSRI